MVFSTSVRNQASCATAACARRWRAAVSGRLLAAGAGIVGRGVNLEARQAELVTHEGDGGGDVAPQPHVPAALGGDGPFGRAVAHQHGPAAGLAEDGGGADRLGLDQAADGLAGDEVGGDVGNGHGGAPGQQITGAQLVNDCAHRRGFQGR